MLRKLRLGEKNAFLIKKTYDKTQNITVCTKQEIVKFCLFYILTRFLRTHTLMSKPIIKKLLLRTYPRNKKNLVNDWEIIIAYQGESD